MQFTRLIFAGLVVAAVAACDDDPVSTEVTPDPSAAIRWVNAVPDTVAMDYRIVSAVSVAALAIAFWFLQIVQNNKFEEMAENNHQRTLALRAPRGILFDRNGKVLVDITNPIDVDAFEPLVLDAGSAAQEIAAKAPAGSGSGSSPSAASSALPTQTFAKDYTLKFGGAEVRLYSFGRGHSGGDTMVYFPDAKVVMVSDQMTDNAPLVDFANGGSAVGWAPILDRDTRRSRRPCRSSSPASARPMPGSGRLPRCWPCPLCCCWPASVWCT